MTPDSPKKVLLVALGGNALIKKGQKGTLSEQFANLREPMQQIARLSRQYRLIITHGNGPQVGDLLLRQEALPELSHHPLEILVAQTQGWLGYMIESTLDGELTRLGVDLKSSLVSLLSYVVVDENDSAFKNPTKPIGPVLTPEQVKRADYPVTQTAKGPRRVVASPKPITIVEKREIKTLIRNGFIVICCGGGGIPVVREGRGFAGVDAVIDKDLASAKLAEDVGVDIFCIATDVPGLALDYGTPKERFLDEVSKKEAYDYLKTGQFPPGSMGPKVEACIKVLENGGQRTFICSTDEITKALDQKAGTHFSL
ncbi:carbamate kinase [Dethiosulfatarculus sandiegensis]|uniref:Carbamate kinase n=1 Tax=Dethiosulfatarculus sandiegensis TaxID=1429043 RepID=A0A0D2J2K9_9BACT|nr:carbamate kinase [Dethiosulfatarculus sandiegensis]KIX12434.1 carbamate kinase [Dethiosulfatarculus sandiegensis]